MADATATSATTPAATSRLHGGAVLQERSTIGEGVGLQESGRRCGNPGERRDRGGNSRGGAAAVSRNLGPRCEMQNGALNFERLIKIILKHFCLIYNFSMCYLYNI
jgi:hypothetical protein